MSEPRTIVDRFYSRIKNNPTVALLIILGTIVIGLSTFTDAAKNLLGLVIKDTRPNINGEWKAEVTYDWQNAKYTETFIFKSDGDEVYGTASFLGTKRGILEGKTRKDKLQFITITQEILGSEPARDTTHDYRGKVLGDEIKFIMQTRGGYSEHIPIEFIAKKVPITSFQPTTR
jgi:hypothetical protein